MARSKLAVPSFPALAVLVLALLAAPAAAQPWKGVAALGIEVKSGKKQPLEGAQVLLRYAEIDPIAGPPALTTGADGKIEVQGLASGRWRVDISKEGYSSYLLVVAVEPDGEARVVSGPVRDATGDRMRCLDWKSKKPQGVVRFERDHIDTFVHDRSCDIEAPCQQLCHHEMFAHVSRVAPFGTGGGFLRTLLLRCRLLLHVETSMMVMSEQPLLPRRLFQSLFLVEEALHELLFLVAVREDFANGLGNQPEGVVVGVAAATEELRHSLRVSLVPESAKAVQHIDQAGGCTICGWLA